MRNVKPRLIAVLALSLVTHAQTAESRLAQAVAASKPGRDGSVVVMDVNSGRVLASHNLDLAQTRLAQPGSTLKPFLYLHLLNAGKLRSDERVYCRRDLHIAGRSMACTHPDLNTALDLRDALAWSCNTYAAEMARRLSASELKQLLTDAGLGQQPLATARNIDELRLQALGHFGIEVTPMQLLQAYRQLALHRLNGATEREAPVYEGLERSAQFGMAHNASVSGLRVAGKTGTASSPHSHQTHAFFVGYAPADKPDIILVVYLPSGRGSDAAALAQPVFAAYANK